jgi:predicted molibdopterin-dependent oxidoreductase YjgC
MYKRLPDLAAVNPNARLLAVTIDGKAFAAREGDTVAATLLAAGLVDCRTTPVTGSPRGPFCMMGVCFDCLVVIDGQPNRQGCMIPAREGMKIERQQGARVVALTADTADTTGAVMPEAKP